MPTTSRTARRRRSDSSAPRWSISSRRSLPAINALWGPLHGGANQSVIEMLESIRERADGARLPRARQERRRERAAHGLRPSRLQELRSAREGHQEGLLTMSSNAWASTARCSRSPRSSKRSRSRTTTSSSASSTRTSTSTRRHLQRDRHPGQHVHGHVRHRPPPGLDRAVEGTPRGSGVQDRPPAPDLHGPDRDGLHADRDQR